MIKKIANKNIYASLLIVLSIGIITILTIQSYNRAYRTIGNDLKCYLISSKTFFIGDNPYTIDSIFPYIYPQFFNIIMYPLTIIPYWIAVAVWLIIGYLSLYCSITFF